MTITDVVKKLVGAIEPVGKTETDEIRLENLKVMCELVNNLVSAINEVAYMNRDRGEHSMRIAGKYVIIRSLEDAMEN